MLLVRKKIVVSHWSYIKPFGLVIILFFNSECGYFRYNLENGSELFIGFHAISDIFYSQ